MSSRPRFAVRHGCNAPTRMRDALYEAQAWLERLVARWRKPEPVPEGWHVPTEDDAYRVAVEDHSREWDGRESGLTLFQAFGIMVAFYNQNAVNGVALTSIQGLGELLGFPPASVVELLAHTARTKVCYARVRWTDGAVEIRFLGPAVCGHGLFGPHSMRAG